MFDTILAVTTSMAVYGALLWLLSKAHKRIDQLELQIYNAWKDGYVIPPPEEVMGPSANGKVVEEQRLPETLEALINEWESPEIKAQLRDQFTMELNQGFGEQAIVTRYIRGTYGPQPEL